jgi:predicted DCC family thiol-disulfide oxidoreductase YuxK
MISNPPPKPLLVFDGDCSFCRLWIDRWKAMTGERVDYAAFQQAADAFPEIPAEHFKQSVQLILPDGEVFGGAHAVFRTLAQAPGEGWMLRLYLQLPGAAAVCERAYRFVARRRDHFYRLTRLLWGRRFEPPTFFLSRWIFLRLLGLVYFFAFLSLSSQITGLVGKDGILPFTDLLGIIRSSSLGLERYWYFPTLAWLNSSDAFLRFLTLGGIFLSLLVILRLATVPALIILWVFYLSLVTAGQDFLAFQWDELLLETGFLAIFFAPIGLRPVISKPPPRLFRWLLWFLLFRLMFSSGAVKLLSGDPSWRHLTALKFHYETQPLPTPMAWFMHLLPGWFHEASVAVAFFIELAVPFLIFAPRRARFLAGSLLIFLQGLIALTGNYAYFNLLTLALCVLLFDDAALARLFPRRWVDRLPKPAGRTKASPLRRVLLPLVGCLLLVAGCLEIAEMFAREKTPRAALVLLESLQPLHVVNSYGLFAVMTTSRQEIIIEGSDDAVTWRAYEFKYKPGDLRRPPPWVEPFQPRLDWQMWFAALGSYRNNPWFVHFMLRLLEGSPEVLALLGGNPFPHAPPRYIRALLYDYHFTDWSTKHAEGNWWRRELRELYFPQVTRTARR